MNSFRVCMPVKTVRTVVVRGRYRYRTDRRLRWLQRLCIWILDRLGCQCYSEQMRVDTIDIHFDRVADLIWAQARGIREITGKLPKYVILGHEQAVELELPTVGQLAWEMPLLSSGRFRGMTVIVAPYFDGVVCLEELSVIVPGEHMR